MSMLQPSALPDPAAIAAHAGALAVLREVQRALAARLAGAEPGTIDLGHLATADLALLGRLLGEGDMAAQVQAPDPGGAGLQANESVFAGVWRVWWTEGGRRVRDTIDVGAVPRGLIDTARVDALSAQMPHASREARTDAAAAVLAELRDRARTWRAGEPAHVVNLTLQPFEPADRLWLDAQLGAGRVQFRSRGPRNCLIASSRLPRTWRVTYFDGAEQVILDTLEIALVPEVACAATQDLEDSAERIAEVIAWVEAA
jgi:hydrogenase-1 operon protein HyaF